MNNLIKIAICGKANSGKNTTAKLLAKALCKNYNEYKILAFANPIKEMVEIMFPQADKKCLYGSSKLRSNIITNAFDKNKNPLSYRQTLIDIGSLGRSYDENHWINIYDQRVKDLPQKIIKKNTAFESKVIIASDLRFYNEYEYLKKNNYFILKIIRDCISNIDDISETNQDQISNDKFDHIIYNNFSLNFLKKEVLKIAESIKLKYQ